MSNDQLTALKLRNQITSIPLLLNQNNTIRKLGIKTITIIFLALLSFSSYGDIRSATGKPLLDFYTVYGALDSVKIMNELCNQYYPNYKTQNDNAYQAWRQKYRDFIYKIEQYNHSIAQKIAKGDSESYRKHFLEAALAYEENKEAMRKTFLEFGPEIFQGSCESYPEYTQSYKADFANYFKEHIQVFEEYWRKKVSN